ncbi:MAG: short-chain dehydrogenase [Gammaproteobacteria bacterium (ex Lamellibrachia satsuma)]|nr:MAG: bifunctional aldolase/short-chain dehydrogenase [Gammaproteobacteria bacterium (ex Lamellibrachia satsuma)]RRS32595.1 MAG: short-chain dehydrogenase [Gammaproteobacteria bacterium (ex Lamellibrachia satsuma)]RRS37245.1 MAG: short-chain dehydrogenase [Gammaproteobacteria bacterium (ex Lamellibrachia satsuma)]
MKSLWNDTEAARFTDDLQLRVYSSRLLGSDPSLVLHGGGNTSVKIRQPDLFGDEEEILYVKGSGWDLATIEAEGYTPVRMAHLLKLATLESLSDLEMVNQLKTQQTIASAPTASVEAILHAALPYKFVDHTHADALVTITNTPDGEARIRELYGDDLVVIPYVMPGFDLARTVAEQFTKEAHEGTLGMVLMNHGLFTFGDTAKASYERMIELVDRAERYLHAEGAWELPEPAYEATAADPIALASLRRGISSAAGFPVVLRSHRKPDEMAFCQRDDLTVISQQGPATPDHVIRTKRLPQLGRDVESYVRDYRQYFDKQSPQSRTPVKMLDPAPRVVLDQTLGLLTIGKSPKEAKIISDIYRHTIEIIQRAERLGGWRALPARDIFDVEYWELEQAKLRKGGKAPQFQGEVALVTGAASGIGKACVDSLLARGAAVVGLDIDPVIETLYQRPDFLGMCCDITDNTALQQSIKKSVLAFGGLDMLVLNAGMFPGGCPVAELPDDEWNQVMQVNLNANLALLRSSHPLLKQAPSNGRVVVIGSKNVPAPGAGAAAYSASKSALTQLSRIVALEWAKDGIRINILHPDAVFDTGIWTQEVLQARASHYGMSVQDYKTRNLLKTEITSHDVAELTAELCGPLFAKTTAAQIPIDGGNERVV